MDDEILIRVNRLGLTCSELPRDRLTSASAALCCFPMYMVANVHAWTGDSQFHIPLLDLPGFESIRESLALGKQEKRFDIEKPHRRVLSSLLTAAKPTDRVMYEYALETLARYLSQATPALAAQVRTAVAKMVVAVARASGEGVFGSGEKINAREKACIEEIAATLDLTANSDAATTLAEAGIE